MVVRRVLQHNRPIADHRIDDREGSSSADRTDPPDRAPRGVRRTRPRRPQIRLHGVGTWESGNPRARVRGGRFSVSQNLRVPHRVRPRRPAAQSGGCTGELEPKRPIGTSALSHSSIQRGGVAGVEGAATSSRGGHKDCYHRPRRTTVSVSVAFALALAMSAIVVIVVMVTRHVLCLVPVLAHKIDRRPHAP